MERWYNDSYRGKPKYSEENVHLYLLSHDKSQFSWPGIETKPPRSEAGRLNHSPSWYDNIYIYLFIYLTAIGLTPGGSSTAYIYIETVQSYIRYT
jgi:hypothetical protein